MRALDLPDFPWDSLTPFAERARAHPGGIVDLSVGSPVDPTPDVIRSALANATDAHSYPATAGSPALRQAIIDWYARRRGVAGLEHRHVLPTIGSKELIASLALMLGLDERDAIVYPATAYPTYAIGAAIARATPARADDPADWPENTKLVWLNSPGNPDGSVLGIDQLRAAVARARELGAIIINDECYAELNWDGDEPTPSILDDRVTDGDRRDVLSVYSLSKQSNLAGYRAGFIAGSSTRIQQLLAVRKHAGLMPPAPVQQAMVVALGDDEHVRVQRERYRARRDILKPALESAGFRVDASTAGLYLWVTEGRPAWETVGRLADVGILCAPGVYYGDDNSQHVRLALTSTDERIGEAASRIGALL